MASSAASRIHTLMNVQRPLMAVSSRRPHKSQFNISAFLLTISCMPASDGPELLEIRGVPETAVPFSILTHPTNISKSLHAFANSISETGVRAPDLPPDSRSSPATTSVVAKPVHSMIRKCFEAPHFFEGQWTFQTTPSWVSSRRKNALSSSSLSILMSLFFQITRAHSCQQ